MTTGRLVPKIARLALAAALLVGIGASVSSQPVTGASSSPGTWAATGSLTQVRSFAPAVRLGDGSVLTAGGTDGVTATATAERWTPTAGTWAAAGSIGQAEAGGVAALLPNGQALFAGGAGDVGYYGFGDLYDSTAGTWTKTPAMAHVHAYGAGAQLANGDLLVIGGMDGSDALTTNAVDIYSASGGGWSAGPSLPGAGRYALTATTMGDGRILAAGGDDGSSGSSAATNAAAIYAAGSGWSAIESMNVARFDHGAVALKDGRILVAGGSDAAGTPLASAEIYDPASGHWTLTGSMSTPRYGQTLTLLSNGWVLAAGGLSAGASTGSSEIFDPASGRWTTTGGMISGRLFHSAVLLTDGSVLAIGGHGSANDGYLASAEVFAPPISYGPTTFHAIAPARILDTRTGNGLAGTFSSRAPRLLQVTGRGNVPSNALAITGILTVTNQSSLGYVSVGPAPTNQPTSSTLNFPVGDNRANNVTVALDQSGRLAIVYCPGRAFSSPGTTDLVFDVTGYFTADDSGATFKTLTPTRVLDTRNGTGLSGKFSNNVAHPLQITGSLVPAGAVAVTGNLTVVLPSSAGWAFVGPSLPSNPVSVNVSMVNSVAGDTKADGVTVALSDTGSLSFVWEGTPGSTTDVVFDVTGYFVNGTSGSRFVPIDPMRVADTRYGLPIAGPVLVAHPMVVPVAGQGHIASTAVAISGNLTVVDQTAAGYLTAAPVAPSTPALTSTLNFPLNDIRANGFDVSLAGDGSLGVVYFHIPGARTQIVVDVTGYFTP
jgi:hypothetical protein